MKPSRPFYLLLAIALVSAPLLGAADGDFNPRTGVSACILWLDATDIDADDAPDSLSDGASVSEWRDKSGQDHHATQTAPPQQPAAANTAIGGKRALRFDGGHWLTDTLKRDWTAHEWTLVVVASMDKETPNGWRGIVGNRFGAGAGKWWTLGTKSDGTSYLEMGAGKGISSSLRPADSTAYVYTVVKSGKTCTLYRSGVRIGEAPVDSVGGTPNDLRIGLWYGTDQGWQGHIAEVLLYDRALSQSERCRVEEYLGGKWAVAAVPDLYEKRASWAETMTAARERYAAYTVKDPVPTEQQQAIALDALWQQIAGHFPEEAALFTGELADGRHLEWFRRSDTQLEQAAISKAGDTPREALAALAQAEAAASDPRWLNLFLYAARARSRFREEIARVEAINLPALRRAIEHLSAAYPDAYPGAEFLSRLAEWERKQPVILDALANCDEGALTAVSMMNRFRREALTANPLLDFEKLLFVRRGANTPRLGLPQNWQSNCILPRSGYDDEIALLTLDSGDIATVYRPADPYFLGDVDLHFDADRLLFSSIGTDRRWHVFEIGVDGSGLRQVTPADITDFDNYDACYLPDGDIMFCSSAYFAAVPCVNGSARTANLFRIKPDGTGMRQLCFDQEHNWCPTMMPSGRVLYQRWEYTDTPHSHDRLLFLMNPDGTGQMEFYGSNSYWPNSLFYARPIPGHATQFVGIVSGHHGVPRMGELVLFDAARGRRESGGAIQRIPGHGIPVTSETKPKYASTLIQDNLVDASWPKFLHPYPLSDSYFLVACKPTPSALWGLYLVDRFDNMLLLKEEPGKALLEPVPLRKTPRPPVIPERVQPDRKDAIIYLTDVYQGGGLHGVPRGAVKQLRVFTYHFLFPRMGGPQAVVGMEGPWDIRRVMGTVPVEADGSAMFRVPANTPIAVQPLDAEGKAIQLMRSWFTAMPGETLSCVGCHESQNSAPPPSPTIASRKAPSDITPWYGPERGFNYDREVQPVLDTYCVKCHDGVQRPDGRTPMDLKTRDHITDYKSVFHSGGKDAGHFSVSYANLHRFVRRPGLESDYHLLMPMEFHADTTQLVQMLRKGHGNVRLDDESWDRLITWIDMNAPFHGTWTEIAGEERVKEPARRRRENLKKYAGVDADFEAVWTPERPPLAGVTPATFRDDQPPKAVPACDGWPLDTETARARQTAAAGAAFTRSIDLGEGIALELALVPAGQFVMGGTDGSPDERPLAPVTIDEPFWMGRFEVTNAQFERFDPSHDSRVESRFSMQFGVRGFYVNRPEQPAVRLSWEQAMAFCAWLSDKTGESFSLPTEAQWEYACRAGTNTPFSYGAVDADFSAHANLADQTLREFVCHTYKKEREPWFNASKYDDWIPKDLRFNDGVFLSDGVGLLQPNAWGLHDMHGNVAEWTLSAYRPYPYRADDGRNDPAGTEPRVVRGGSWRDRPHRATSSFRLAYRPYQPVYNVGFRVVCPAKATKVASAE